MKQQEEEVLPAKQIDPAALRLTNVAYALFDASDTLLRDSYDVLSKQGLDIKHDIKRRYKLMLAAINNARKATTAFVWEMYNMEDSRSSDTACQVSDFFADLCLLAADRIGDDEERQEIVRKTLLRMKSIVPIYEKYTHIR